MGLDDGDIRRIKTQDEAAKRLDDFAAELSGTKSGYIYRSSAADDDSRPDIRAKKARKAVAQLSALQQLLNDPEYAEAYGEARQTIDDFKERMSARLAQYEQRIEVIDQKLDGHAPGSPEHRRLMREREGLQKRQQDLLDYYNETIRPFEDRMNDPDNPISKDDLYQFNDNVQRDMEHRFFNEPVPTEPRSQQTADAKLPTLG